MVTHWVDPHRYFYRATKSLRLACILNAVHLSRREAHFRWENDITYDCLHLLVVTFKDFDDSKWLPVCDTSSNLHLFYILRCPTNKLDIITFIYLKMLGSLKSVLQKAKKKNTNSLNTPPHKKNTKNRLSSLAKQSQRVLYLWVVSSISNKYVWLVSITFNDNKTVLKDLKATEELEHLRSTVLKALSLMERKQIHIHMYVHIYIEKKTYMPMYIWTWWPIHVNLHSITPKLFADAQSVEHEASQGVRFPHVVNRKQTRHTCGIHHIAKRTMHTVPGDVPDQARSFVAWGIATTVIVASGTVILMMFPQLQGDELPIGGKFVRTQYIYWII